MYKITLVVQDDVDESLAFDAEIEVESFVSVGSISGEVITGRVVSIDIQFDRMQKEQK